MKLIIDIPDNIYDAIKEAQMIISGQRSGKTFLQILVSSVENGTPLDSDSERAETQAYFAGEAYGWEQGRKALIDDVKAEIAEEICLTNNPYTGETKYTIEHLKLLEILDRIAKESETN